jgi:hypothetical protein
MAHLANYLLLFGGFVLILGIVLAFNRFLENRRKKAAEFRNYFCSSFESDLFPFTSFGDDETLGGNHPKFAPIRLRSFADNDRSIRSGTSLHDLE